MLKSSLLNSGSIGDLASELTSAFYDKDVLNAIIEYAQTTEDAAIKSKFRDLLVEVANDYLEEDENGEI